VCVRALGTRVQQGGARAGHAHRASVAPLTALVAGARRAMMNFWL
jgi:hypothetical protein